MSDALSSHCRALHRSLLVVVIILSAVLHPSSLGAQADVVVPSLSPSRLFVEVGTSLNTVSCSIGDTALSPDDTFRWVDANSTIVNTSSAAVNSSRIFSNSSSGTLTLKDAQEIDSGTYSCYYVNTTQCGGYVDSSNFTSLCPNASLTYKVYVMPDYTTDGIVIGVINAVLLVIFIASLVRSAIIDRRRLKKYGQKF